jgi:hypothetical protein
MLVWTFAAPREVCAAECGQMGLEKPWNTTGERRPVRPRVGNSRPSRHEWPRVGTLHPLPEIVELGKAILRRIARNDAGVDGTYRGPNNPIRFDSHLAQRLVYADLVGTEGATALKHKHDLSVRLPAKFIDRLLNHCLGHVTHLSLP